MITESDVVLARSRIRGHVRRTPLLDTGATTGALLLKCEFLQHAGVFKTRGAFNRQLAAKGRGDLDPAVGIVVASGGNAGLAHAFAAGSLGVPATVFVPETVPAAKLERLRSYGAGVRRVGTEYSHAADAAARWGARTGAVFCHAYDDAEVVAGAGTIGLEILQDAPDVDTIVVAVGGGGLFAGISAAVAGRVRVVAAEPAGAPTLHAALAAGGPVDVAVGGVAADALGARRLGGSAWAAATAHRPVSVLVDDDAIVDARRALWERYRIAAEHGAAVAAAALGPGAYVPAAGERVAVVVCGANTDPATLGAAPA